MKHLFQIAIILICATPILGCSFLNTIVKEQQWSENYALLEGVEANDPAFIDGDLGTIGESQFPDTSQRKGLVTGSDFPPSEAVIILPKTKHIYKIVIHTANMQVFDIFARDIESGGWEKIETIKGNSDEKLSLKLSQVAVTDGIKVRVKRTSDDASQRHKNVRRIEGWRIISGNIRSAGKIREIELYGYVSTKTKSEKPDEVDLEEVNKLLNEK